MEEVDYSDMEYSEDTKAWNFKDDDKNKECFKLYTD